MPKGVYERRPRKKPDEEISRDIEVIKLMQEGITKLLREVEKIYAET